MALFPFDDLVRDVSRGRTRRGMAQTLAALLVGGVAAAGSSAGHAGKRKKRKQRCRGSKTRCGKQCVKLLTDPQHCGRCGVRCEGGGACVDGRCASGCAPCAAGQACVEGECTCPEAACAQAVDPTDDQFEECFCAPTVEGDQRCFANISCASDPPPCTSSAECAEGFACMQFGCGGEDRCTPVCLLD